MKNYKLIYNSTGKLQEPIEESEFYVAQQEEGSVAFIATFPAFLVGKVKAYIEFKGGGEIIECGDINLNSNCVTLTLSSSDYLMYNFLKVGFEVVTSTAQIRFQPVKLEVDEFVNVTGTNTKQAYTVSVKVGTITPLENGQDPYVENVGTGKDVVLNFGLPKYIIDQELSDNSPNPVANKVIAEALKALEDELNQKADITWIDIQADLYDAKESYLYPLLDTITDNGFYGIRLYEVLHGGEDGNEEFHVPIYTEYLMVSTRGNYSDEITQMYLDSEQGLRIRHGKRQSDNTVAWDEWNEQFDFDYVDRTSEQDITGRKHFMDGISVTELGAINTDLTIRAADSLKLNCDGDVIFEGGKIGQTSVLAILNEIEALKNRIADLESVNADLENIIEMQENYIGGEEA